MKTACTVCMVTALLVGPPAARAGWSAPQSFRAPSYYSGPAVAVNQRGDAVIAWATRGSPARPPRPGTSVHVAARTAHGRLISRRVWRSRRAVAGAVSAAIDRRGEVTVAWTSRTRRQQVTPGSNGRIRVAYGRLSRRWTRARVVGAGDDATRVAVAPDGRVLLVWVADAYANRIAVAWRMRGHRFGRPRALSRPRAVSTPYSSIGAVPAFDARGTAYVAGECDGVVLRARPHSRRLRTALAQRDVLGMNLSLLGADRGLVSWIGGRCTPDVAVGPTLGPVFASVLRAGRFGTPLMLTSADVQARLIAGVAAPDGGGTVSWADPVGVSSARIRPGGTVEPIPLTSALVPFAVDGGGDQVLSGWGSAPLPRRLRVIVRPEGGADQASPYASGHFAVSTPVGRRVALVWNADPTGTGGRLAVSVWRP